MRKMALLLLILPVYCYGDWQYVKNTSYGDVYWNKASIQKNQDNEYLVEILTDYRTRQKGIDRIVEGKLIYDTHFKPLSLKEAILVHCKQRKSALLGEIYFSEKMGKGVKLFSEAEPNPSWSDEGYGDIDHVAPVIRSLVCSGK